MPRNGIPVPYASCAYGGGCMLGYIMLHVVVCTCRCCTRVDVAYLLPLPSFPHFWDTVYHCTWISLFWIGWRAVNSKDPSGSASHCHLISQTSPSIFFQMRMALFPHASHACLVPTEAKREEDIGSLELELHLNGYQPWWGLNPGLFREQHLNHWVILYPGAQHLCGC